MHTQGYKMYHQQEATKNVTPVVLDVIPPHYTNIHHGQPSPPQSPNTTQYTKGKKFEVSLFMPLKVQRKSVAPPILFRMHQFRRYLYATHVFNVSTCGV